MKISHFHHNRRGFSFVEILMVVAVISTMGAVGIVATSGFTQAAEGTRLDRDVATVNRAIKTYLSNGGKFSAADVASATRVIRKLKTSADADSQKEMAGLKQAMVDPRLTTATLSSEEAATNRPRAKWIADAANPHFAIVNTGPGIKEFLLDESLATVDYGTEVRSGAQKLAKVDKWVWDFADSASGAAPMTSGPSPSDDPSLPDPTAPAMIQLTPPTFTASGGGGKCPMSHFPKTLTLSHTNPAGSGQINYSVNGSAFRAYEGALTVHPGMYITAITSSTDPDTYRDSNTSQEGYTTDAVTLVPTLSFAATTYDYFQLGGLNFSGATVGSTGISGTGNISNLADVPVSYQNSTIFNFQWTVLPAPGANPLTAPSPRIAAPFTGGFPPVNLPVTIADFGTASSIVVQAAVKGLNTAVVTDSVVVSHTITASPVTLPPPLITITERMVTLAADTSGAGRVPASTRIYYTVNGTDPGNNAGEPVSGTLYTGTFTLSGSTGSNVTVTARCYPPSTKKMWFTTSALASQVTALPAPVDLYVGGNFINSSGNAMRNIARLNSAGQLDPAFNTGSGTNPDSVVGVLQQVGAGLLVGGDFSTINGGGTPALIMLNADGSVNAAFNAGLTAAP